MLNGVKIDPHQILEDLEERIKAIEHNNFMNQTRTEALENWVLKQGENIDKLSDKLSTMDVNGAIIKEIEALKKKVLSREMESTNIRSKLSTIVSDLKESRI